MKSDLFTRQAHSVERSLKHKRSCPDEWSVTMSIKWNWKLTVLGVPDYFIRLSFFFFFFPSAYYRMRFYFGYMREKQTNKQKENAVRKDSSSTGQKRLEGMELILTNLPPTRKESISCERGWNLWGKSQCSYFGLKYKKCFTRSLPSLYFFFVLKTRKYDTARQNDSEVKKGPAFELNVVSHMNNFN